MSDIVFRQDTGGDLKFWTDGMGTSVGTLTFDESGVRLAVGHGRTVTLADQIALCASPVPRIAWP